MKKYTYILTGIVVIALLFTFTYKKDDIKAPIRIGATTSLTGVAADFGDMSKKAMELAVKEINAQGGIEGRMVELYIEDDGTDPKTAVTAYQKLVHVDHVNAVIGGLFDFTAKPLLPLALEDKIAFVSPINFQIDGSFDMNKQTFVMYPKFEKVVKELDSVIESKGIKKLGMIRYESGFGKSIQDTLQSIMDSHNKELVAETYKAIGTSDFRTNIVKLKDVNPDAVFLDMLDFDIVKYLKDSHNLGFKKQIIAYTTLRDVLNKKDADVSDLEGALMLDWEISSQEFSNVFKTAYGVAPRRGANKSYDAIYMLAEAIAKSNNDSDVSSYIESHTFKTMNGEFNFDSSHAVLNTPVKVFEVREGKLVEVKSNI